MNKENIIDLSKLPAVEGKNIVNIIALNGAGEIIKADSDYITTESLAATIEPFVTDEELDDRLTDYYMDGEVDELLSETKEEILGDYSNIEPEYQVKTLAGLTQVILDNELVIATALNQLNDGKADVSEPLFNEWKNTSTNIAIGSGSTANTNGIAIGPNVHSLGGVIIGSAKSGVNLTPGVNQVFIGRELENCHTSDAVAIGKSCPNTLPYDKLDGTLHTIENCSVNLNGKLYADWFGNIYIKYENSLGNTKRIKLQDYLQRQWTGTQAQYDALEAYDDNTTYYIIEG